MAPLLAALVLLAQDEAAVRKAVERSIPLLEKGVAGAMSERTCFTCHNHALPYFALTAAKRRGFKVDEAALQGVLERTEDFLRRNRENYRQGKGQGGQVDTAGYALWTLAEGGWAPDETTAAVAHYLKVRDADKGHWKNVSVRPPSEASPFTTTFLGLYGLRRYGADADRAAKALAWLKSAPPQDTEDRVFRLRAFVLEGRPVEEAVRDLLGTQRADGGWSQLPGGESDAYATATVLAALGEAGASNPRGLAWLLGAQQEDGSWRVVTRSKPIQKYFESGYPHGKDQFISIAAGAWATLALVQALPAAGGIRLVRVEPGEFAMGAGEAPPRTKAEWQERDWDEAPVRTVRISKAFEIGVTEVTVAQYAAFDPAHPRPKGAKDDEPVVRVSWERARAFCAWMSEREKKPCRLPTEAEWEYAARKGAAAPGNLKSKGLLPVAGSPADGLGLHDLLGNAAEWCLDLYGPYDPDDRVDPVGAAEGVARVVRGGSFLSTSARASDRAGHLPDDANRATGFRVVVGEPPATAPRPLRPAPSVEVGKSAGPLPPHVNHTRAKTGPAIPKDSWGPLFSAWNHYAAVCVCPNGDVLAAWYTTVSEEGRELAQASSRLPAGAERWEPARLFFDVPGVNDHAPVLLSDGKRVFHFFTQSLRGWDDASDWVRVSEDSGATWSAPRLVAPREGPVRLSQPCSAFVAADGAIVLAVDGDGHGVERILRSVDGGLTWTLAGGDLRKAAGAYAIHPAIAPGSDGSILCFLRGPDPLPLLVSKDRGETWEVRTTPFSPVTVGQKAAALRLSSGALLLVSHDSKKRHVDGGAFAALSFDDGATWPHVRRLEGVDGYLAAAQGADGRIHVVGSKMSAVSFSESWLLTK